MMSSYVCRQCSSRLVRRAVSARNPQWQPRATFISLRNKNRASEGEPSGNPTRLQDDKSTLPDGQQDVLGAHSPRDKNSTQRLGRYSRHAQKVEENDSVVEGNRSFKITSYDPYNREPSASNPNAHRQPIGEGSYARLIEEALKQGDVENAWRLFTSSYTSRDCEALTNPSFSDVSLLNRGKIFQRLLNAVNKALCKGSKDVSVTPTAVLFRYEQLGIARPEFWARSTITYLTYQALFASRSKGMDLQNQCSPATIWSEVLSLWRLFFQCKGKDDDALESINGEWLLPDTKSSTDLQENRDFGMRLQNYHPKYLSNPDLQFSALYLFTASEALKELSLEKEAAPFIRLLTHCLAGSRVSPVFRHTTLSQDFKLLGPEEQNEIISSINSAPQKALNVLGLKMTLPEDETPVDPTSNLEQFHLKRIARAIKSQSHAGALDRLWDQVESAYTPREGKPTIPIRIYNAFLSGFMELLQSGRSVQIWNHMVAHGIKPEQSTWVALLEGCEKARDLDGLNAVWARMIKAGIEPDNYAWTTRVHALVSLRHINVGLAAMDEMGQKWLAAEDLTNGSKRNRPRKSTTQVTNPYTKPSVEVINGAISGLVQLPRGGMRYEKRIEFVQKILQWSQNFDIKPDVRTYNSLIQLYLGAQDYKTATRILRQMDEQGVEADVATHTMLIAAAFDNHKFDSLSEKEQEDRIMSLFTDLEASGLNLNAYVYSIAIDRLIKRYNNITAVRRVIDHMQSRNLAPSPQIYTSLITHYFHHQPPAIAAVDTLVHQIFTSHRTPTDKILFDRIIEGYAAHGEVGNMMSVLTRMSKHGKLPGWTALKAVVQALVKAGDMHRARQVVKDVEMGEGVAKGGITGGQQLQNEFFDTARRLGIVPEQNREAESSRSGWVDDTSEAMRVQETNGIVQEKTPDGMNQVEIPEAEEDIHGFLTEDRGGKRSSSGPAYPSSS